MLKVLFIGLFSLGTLAAHQVQNSAVELKGDVAQLKAEACKSVAGNANFSEEAKNRAVSKLEQLDLEQAVQTLADEPHLSEAYKNKAAKQVRKQLKRAEKLLKKNKE